MWIFKELLTRQNTHFNGLRVRLIAVVAGGPCGGPAWNKPSGPMPSIEPIYPRYRGRRAELGELVRQLQKQRRLRDWTVKSDWRECPTQADHLAKSRERGL